MSKLIKDLANCERPYEKALSNGIDSLSDSELLALIIKTGTKNESAIDLANEILNLHPVYKGLVGLNYVSRKDLTQISGIGDTKATVLLSISEIVKRMNISVAKSNISFDSVDTVARYYIEKCKYLKREKTFVVMLDSAGKLIRECCLSEGTVNEAHLSPREVFIEALKYEAVCIIIIHNHPSGNVIPSEADKLATHNIVRFGRELGINVLDHIIVGDNNYYSMFEKGVLE